MKLSHKTRQQLWRELLVQSAAPRDAYTSAPWLAPWLAVVAVLLTVIALYLFTQL